MLISTYKFYKVKSITLAELINTLIASQTPAYFETMDSVISESFKNQIVAVLSIDGKWKGVTKFTTIAYL